MTTLLLVVACVVPGVALAAVSVIALHRSRDVSALTAELEQARERERHRLAQELHDEVGQKLALLKMQIQLAARANDGAAATLQPSVDLLDSVIADVRSISGTLKPTPFEPGLLVPAVRVLAQREALRAGLAILVDVADDRLALPREVELACYAVIREAIANVIKHADAQHVAVTLACGDHTVTVRVEDDGRGFDVRAGRQAATTGGHLGLRGVEERLAAVGGTLRLRSERTVGTTLECVMPLVQSS